MVSGFVRGLSTRDVEAFGESRRHTKVLGRLPGVQNSLSLVWLCWIGPASAGGALR